VGELNVRQPVVVSFEVVENRIIMKTLKLGLCAVVLCAALSATAQTQKIGLIDLRKVFEGFYKTKQIEASLKEETSELEKQNAEMVGKFHAAENEFKQLIEKANDQAVSAQEREKHKGDADKKLLQLRDQEQQLSAFSRQMTEKMTAKQMRLREKLLEEIRDVINVKAKAGGFTMVFDTTAQSYNTLRSPALLYSAPGEGDVLTDSVLTQLNATAPKKSDSDK
jgi:outer membrane protein